MSWYKTPIQPIDPVVVSQQPKPPIRYVRDNFTGTGQDSHTQPPAQEQSMWQSLVNVMPITNGTLQRRCGLSTLYPTHGAIGSDVRLYNFQSDALGVRYLLGTSATGVTAIQENDGTVAAALYTPTAAVPIRSVTSRDYQYFCDGNPTESLKWDGANPVTRWGIDATDVTANNAGGGSSGNSYGPRFCTSITDRGGAHPWTGQGTLNAGGSTASCLLSGVNAAATNVLTLDAAGFTVPGGVIAGVSVAITGSVVGTYNTFTAHVALVKGGSAYTSYKNIGPSKGGFGTTLGGTNDLWGGTWTLSDINSAGFGVQVYVNVTPNVSHGTTSLSATVHITSVQVTVYTTTSGSSSTSGSGVGIQSIGGGGQVTLSVGRIYYLTFYNSNSGHFSDLTVASPSTGPTNNAQITLLLATSNFVQVTHKYLLATADGNDPSVLYLVAELTNGGGGDVKTYVDNTPDATLVTQQTLLFTDQFGNEFGVANNLPCPGATLACKHKSRMWVAGVPGATHSVFFSKGIGDLTMPNGYIAGKYEESFPGSNYFDVSDGAESVAGLLSDGQTLYIGTQNHIRRLVGSDPNDFQQPEIVHPNVGLINQEVWQLVFVQGTPAGAIWMTPDFRVMQSDFNTYIDIGKPIQNILNNLQGTAVAQLAHASYFADGEYELYMLQVPSVSSTVCDLNLVYDLRNQMWYQWTFGSNVSGSFASLFNITAAGVPQWLFADPGGNILQWNISSVDDAGTPITCSATTSWLHLGEPVRRKLLNEAQIYGDTAMTVDVTGANNQADFGAPVTVVTGGTLRQSPFKSWNLYLVNLSTHHKYYQFTFHSSATGVLPTVLGSYAIQSYVIDDV